MAVTSTSKGSRKDKMPEKKPVKSAVGSTIDNAISMLKAQEKEETRVYADIPDDDTELAAPVEAEEEMAEPAATGRAMQFGHKNEKKIDKEKVTGYLPVGLAKEFREECKRQNISISYCMETLVKMFLGIS